MRPNPIVVALVVAFLAGCDGGAVISGRVLDPQGTPIPGAVIRVEPLPGNEKLMRPREAVSGANGAYEHAFTHAPVKAKYLVTTTRVGYQPDKHYLTNGAHRNHDIRLIPENERLLIGSCW
jgi:hypothetical protein